MNLELTDEEVMTLVILLGNIRIADLPTDDDALNVKNVHKKLKNTIKTM